VTSPNAVALLAVSGIAAALVAAAIPFRRVSVPVSVPVGASAVADTGRPTITLLYQNFPNPFPTAASRVTCIWFDLNRTTSVSLTVHDVRGNLVRRILPNASTPQFLQPGRYGRTAPTVDQGCDPALTWDGRASDGSLVPRGVYLIRLHAGGTQSIKKAVFQGP
jgi:hypothetical protein